MNLHYVYHTYLFKSKPENMYYHTNNEAKPTITQITIYFNLCSWLHIIHSSKTIKAQFNHANIITAKQSQLCTQVENNATQKKTVTLNSDFIFQKIPPAKIMIISCIFPSMFTTPDCYSACNHMTQLYFLKPSTHVHIKTEFTFISLP